MQGSFPQDLKVPQFVYLFVFICQNSRGDQCKVRFSKYHDLSKSHSLFVCWFAQNLKGSKKERNTVDISGWGLVQGGHLYLFVCLTLFVVICQNANTNARKLTSISGWVLEQGGHPLVNWCQGGSFHRGEILLKFSTLVKLSTLVTFRYFQPSGTPGAT